jgi:hypothetical protein
VPDGKHGTITYNRRLGKRLFFAKHTIMNIKIRGLFRDDDIDFVNDAKTDFAQDRSATDTGALPILLN